MIFVRLYTHIYVRTYVCMYVCMYGLTFMVFMWMSLRVAFSTLFFNLRASILRYRERKHMKYIIKYYILTTRSVCTYVAAYQPNHIHNSTTTYFNSHCYCYLAMLNNYHPNPPAAQHWSSWRWRDWPPAWTL